MPGLFQPSTAWTDAFLEPLRQIGDPPADRAIATLFAAGDVDAVNALMRNLVTNEGMLPETLPDAVKTHDAWIAAAAEKVSRLLINAAVLVARGGDRPTFAIPGQLKQQWGVNWLG